MSGVSSYTRTMTFGLRWRLVPVVLVFTAVWFVCVIPILTNGLLADIYMTPLADIRTIGFAIRFIGTFVLALSPPMVVIGEIVR